MKTIKITFLMIFALLVSNNVNAQWTTDTDENTLVVDSEGLDMQARSSIDGKTYVVFWEAVAPPTNIELRLQILDVDGTQLLGDNGMLVSDAIPMSTYTVIWNITTDNEGNLYIGVTGTGGGEQAYVFKLDSSGNHLWGANGVNIGSGYAVTILPLSNGEAIVSWWPADESVIQKYDASGNAIWGAPQPIVENGNSTVPANMFELSDGEFIIVFHSLTFTIYADLFAQRYNVDGDAQWTNATKLSDHSLQWNIPYSGVSDGDVVYMGYRAVHDNRFDSYLQRLNPDGTLPWGINGMDFDTNQTDFEMDTKIAYESGSQYIWAVCTYTNTGQSEKGEYLQKFDKDTGDRQLTDNAKVIYPIGEEKVHSGSLQLKNDSPLILLKSGMDNGASPTTLSALYLDANGDFAWPEESRPLATFSANKSRIQFTSTVNDQNVAVFIEDKGDGEKIYAQNFYDEILSIGDNELKSSIFFTNPVSENWNVKSENTISSISIYNVLGQSIFELSNDSSNEVSINTENWNSGMYILKITTEVGVVSKQIIKN